MLGCRVQDAGYRLVGCNYKGQGALCRMQGLERRVKDAGYRLVGCNYKGQGALCRM